MDCCGSAHYRHVFLLARDTVGGVSIFSLKKKNWPLAFIAQYLNGPLARAISSIPTLEQTQKKSLLIFSIASDSMAVELVQPLHHAGNLSSERCRVAEKSRLHA